MPHNRHFHIHGDNIVECERTLDLIQAALGSELISVSTLLGSPVCPEYQLRLRAGVQPLRFTYFPGFGRWNEDFLQFVRNRGGTLREAADAIITEVSSGSEEPLIAIEYCGALPAGNQAWQRSGRAYSFGLAGIPFLYVAELGGFELDGNRGRKAARMPNPAVPFSYLAYSLERRTPVLPIFVTSPGADRSSRQQYGQVFADDELRALVRAVILKEPVDATLTALRQKVLELVRLRAGASARNSTLPPDVWSEAYKAANAGTPLVTFLRSQQRIIAWCKTAYIAALTPTTRSLMDLTANHAAGLTSANLPMCIIFKEKRRAFAAQVERNYKSLPEDFAAWLGRDQDLVICWVMGFKPRGDDARPDRGLPPLARMLVGGKEDLLTGVYGPAPAATWPMLSTNPAALVERNGLWEAILEVSDAILVDSATDTTTNHGFLRSHWKQEDSERVPRPILVNPMPLRLGENDVDTVLHTLLARLTGSEAYEGMCNPPGGDWSGISLHTEDRSLELRWLSLPRVSGSNAKRPDHVFQFFGLTPAPIILAVESKETGAAVEPKIGPRLIAYLTSLISSPASIERSEADKTWTHSQHHLRPESFAFASAVAFMSTSETDTRNVVAKADANIVLAFSFAAGGKTCRIRLVPITDIGHVLARYICRLNIEGTGISVTAT